MVSLAAFNCVGGFCSLGVDHFELAHLSKLALLECGKVNAEKRKKTVDTAGKVDEGVQVEHFAEVERDVIGGSVDVTTDVNGSSIMNVDIDETEDLRQHFKVECIGQVRQQTDDGVKRLCAKLINEGKKRIDDCLENICRTVGVVRIGVFNGGDSRVLNTEHIKDRNDDVCKAVQAVHGNIQSCILLTEEVDVCNVRRGSINALVCKQCIEDLLETFKCIVKCLIEGFGNGVEISTGFLGGVNAPDKLEGSVFVGDCGGIPGGVLGLQLAVFVGFGGEIVSGSLCTGEFGVEGVHCCIEHCNVVCILVGIQLCCHLVGIQSNTEVVCNLHEVLVVSNLTDNVNFRRKIVCPYLDKLAEKHRIQRLDEGVDQSIAEQHVADHILDELCNVKCRTVFVEQTAEQLADEFACQKTVKTRDDFQKVFLFHFVVGCIGRILDLVIRIGVTGKDVHKLLCVGVKACGGNECKVFIKNNVLEVGKLFGGFSRNGEVRGGHQEVVDVHAVLDIAVKLVVSCIGAYVEVIDVGVILDDHVEIVSKINGGADFCIQGCIAAFHASGHFSCKVSEDLVGNAFFKKTVCLDAIHEALETCVPAVIILNSSKHIFVKCHVNFTDILCIFC